MANLPRPSGKELVRFLEARGFTLVRIRGSHHYLQRDERRTTVPVHGNQTRKIGTLKSILRDTELSAEDFTALWNG